MIEVSYKIKCDICSIEMNEETYKLPNLCQLPHPSQIICLRFRDLFLCGECFIKECQEITERTKEIHDQTIKEKNDSSL